MTIAFDTHRVFKILKEGHFSDEQAETLTRAFSEAGEESLEKAIETTIATKEDVRAVEVRLIKWMFGFWATLIVFQMGSVFALIQFLSK